MLRDEKEQAALGFTENLEMEKMAQSAKLESFYLAQMKEKEAQFESTAAARVEVIRQKFVARMAEEG